MKLQDYLEKNDIPFSDFAKRVGIAYPSLWRILNKKRNPSKKLCEKIEAVTGNQVTRHDLLPEMSKFFVGK
jgi:DNA-binding transcriptional regulator YdaS (Cro superfamily)